MLKRKKERDVSQVWNEASEEWVDFVRTGKDYSRDFVNNPAAFRLIGNVRKKTVLDMACGEGYNTRILARKGASVTGIDSSRKLIDLAKAEERKEPLGITYHLMSASHLKRVSSSSFDIVTCFMALHDIENYGGAVAEASRILKKGGRFIFSIPHPCFEDMIVNGVKVNAAKRYYDNVRYPLYWTMERLRRSFTTVSFHRPLTDYSRVLARHHLLTIIMVEPLPSKRAMQQCLSLRKGWSRPWVIIFNTVKSR
jgi:2-polyprenyl-3-methyl-5-hydroxy-6-metoxy-1,4-benzoquinol methylase